MLAVVLVAVLLFLFWLSLDREEIAQRTLRSYTRIECTVPRVPREYYQ